MLKVTANTTSPRSLLKHGILSLTGITAASLTTARHWSSTTNSQGQPCNYEDVAKNGATDCDDCIQFIPASHPQRRVAAN